MLQKRESQRKPFRTNESGRRVGMLYLKKRTWHQGKWKREEVVQARRRYYRNVNLSFRYGGALEWHIWRERKVRLGELAARPRVCSSTLKTTYRLRALGLLN